jgi:hypothetical protein
VGSIGIVVADPPTNPCSCLTAGLEGIEVDALVLKAGPPLSFDQLANVMLRFLAKVAEERFFD